MSYIVCPLLKRYVTGDAAMIIQCLKYVLKSAVIKFALLHSTYTQLQLDMKDSSNANTSLFFLKGYKTWIQTVIVNQAFALSWLKFYVTVDLLLPTTTYIFPRTYQKKISIANSFFIAGAVVAWKLICKLHYALCSRNFQNGKSRLDFVEVGSSYCHSNFTWNQIFAKLK